MLKQVITVMLVWAAAAYVVVDRLGDIGGAGGDAAAVTMRADDSGGPLEGLVHAVQQARRGVWQMKCTSRVAFENLWSPSDPDRFEQCALPSPGANGGEPDGDDATGTAESAR